MWGERGRQTDRQTDRQTGRQTETDRQKQTDKNRLKWEKVSQIPTEKEI